MCIYDDIIDDIWKYFLTKINIVHGKQIFQNFNYLNICDICDT